MLIEDISHNLSKFDAHMCLHQNKNVEGIKNPLMFGIRMLCVTKDVMSPQFFIP